MSALHQIEYLLRETVTGLRRAGWMNWAAVSVLMILLYLFGLGWQGVWYVQQGLGQLGAQLEVSVYLKPSVRGQDLVRVAKQVPGVTGVALITREQAWTELQKIQMIPEDLTAAVGENPLVDVLRLKIATPAQVPTVAKVVRTWDSVAEVSYGSETAQRLTQLQQALSSAGLVILSLLAIAAVAVVTTTIGLTVAARQREIEVMQLVGASPLWVYLPFMLEGLVLGSLGALAAWSLLTVTATYVQQQLATQLSFLDVALPSPEPWLLPLLLAAGGLGLGILGSGFAVLRHSKH